MKGIDLEILFHTEGTLELEKLGVETQDLGEFDTMTFYDIRAIGRHFTDKTRSIIHSNSTAFICNLTYEQLKEKLSKW